MAGPLRIGIAGLGTVGAGVVRLLDANGDLIARRAGRPIVVTAVSARDRGRDRGVALDRFGWEDDATTLAARTDVDLVVELVGGADGPALTLARATLAAGKGLIVAVAGGNVATRAEAMPWYRGPTLLDLLDRAPVRAAATGGFAMPVQWVSRPDDRFRGFAGTIARGTVRRGDAVAVLPGGHLARVERIVTFDGDLPEAEADQAVTIALDRDIECAAGATLVAAGNRPDIGDELTADLVWLDDRPLAIGRRYLLQLASTRVPAQVEAVLERPDGAEADAPLVMNGIAAARVRTQMPIVALPYADNQALGAFVLIDPATNATAAAGMIRSLGGAQAAPAQAAAPIYAFSNDGRGAEAAFARLRATGSPAVLIDDAALRRGIAADLPEAADAALWQRATATATLIADAGITVVLAIAAPADTAPFGRPWPGEDGDAGDWVI